ncbi:MAG: Maf family protein [Planctomycetota bacterium]|nr:Maf family protein [Planctomycetota bacterium]
MTDGARFSELQDPGRIVLASQSPRRVALLSAAGWNVVPRAPTIDDGRLSVDLGDPERTVLSLAWFKAAQLGVPLDAFVSVAADTVCFAHGRILGKPRDRAEAKDMLRRLQAGDHRTLSGVCLMTNDGRRRFMVDTATVRLGRLEEGEVEAYLDGGAWRDKAGGYNLADRQAAGWPIECVGDPGTVMGLPMERLQPWLVQESRRFLQGRGDA